MPIYDYLARNPEVDAAYTAIMTAATSSMAAALTRSYDFSGMSTVVDVGGGRGAFLTAILRAHPHLRGILFDRSSAVAGARDALKAHGVAERCDVVAGNFFEGLPVGSDVYMLKWVISEWSDDRAAVILKNCRRAMTVRGRVLVIEPLDVPSNALFNLNMLVAWNGGRVRADHPHAVADEHRRRPADMTWAGPPHPALSPFPGERDYRLSGGRASRLCRVKP
jgi:hypothetical protein